MTKKQLAKAIENHHLYQPIYSGDKVYSKNYYLYNPDKEIAGLMKKSKQELQDFYDSGYAPDGRELQAHEME